MAHGDAREGKWKGNWRMEWLASTLHTTSEHGVSSITTADAHTSAASSQLNWRPRRFKWTSPFCRKTKSGFCACAITFQTQSATALLQVCQMWPLILALFIGHYRLLEIQIFTGRSSQHRLYCTDCWPSCVISSYIVLNSHLTEWRLRSQLQILVRSSI